MDSSIVVLCLLVGVIVLLIIRRTRAVARNRWLNEEFPTLLGSLRVQEYRLIIATNPAFSLLERVEVMLKYGSLSNLEKSALVRDYFILKSAQPQVESFCNYMRLHKDRYNNRPVWLMSELPSMYQTWSDDRKRIANALHEIKKLNNMEFSY